MNSKVQFVSLFDKPEGKSFHDPGSRPSHAKNSHLGAKVLSLFIGSVKLGKRGMIGSTWRRGAMEVCFHKIYDYY